MIKDKGGEKGMVLGRMKDGKEIKQEKSHPSPCPGNAK